MRRENFQPTLFALPEPAPPPQPHVICTGVDGVTREEPVEILCKRWFSYGSEWWIKVRFASNRTTMFVDIPQIVNMPDLRTIEEGW